MKVFLNEYCPCRYESAFQVISVHKTITGAYKAMKKNMVDCYEEMMSRPFRAKGQLLGDYELFRISSIELEGE